VPWTPSPRGITPCFRTKPRWRAARDAAPRVARAARLDGHRGAPGEDPPEARGPEPGGRRSDLGHRAGAPRRRLGRRRDAPRPDLDAPDGGLPPAPEPRRLLLPLRAQRRAPLPASRLAPAPL